MVNSKSSETASRCGRPSRTSRSQSPGEGHVSLCPGCCCSAQSSTTINGQGHGAPASRLFPRQQTANGMYVCFRPGCCAGEGSAAAYKSSTTFPDETLTFIKTFPLMDESVPSVNDRPYFTRTTSRYQDAHSGSKLTYVRSYQRICRSRLSVHMLLASDGAFKQPRPPLKPIRFTLASIPCHIRRAALLPTELHLGSCCV